MRTGLVGHDCAETVVAVNTSRAAAALRNKVCDMSFSSAISRWYAESVVFALQQLCDTDGAEICVLRADDLHAYR